MEDNNKTLIPLQFTSKENLNVSQLLGHENMKQTSQYQEQYTISHLGNLRYRTSVPYIKYPQNTCGWVGWVGGIQLNLNKNMLISNINVPLVAHCQIYMYTTHRTDMVPAVITVTKETQHALLCVEQKQVVFQLRYSVQNKAGKALVLFLSYQNVMQVSVFLSQT